MMTTVSTGYGIQKIERVTGGADAVVWQVRRADAPHRSLLPVDVVHLWAVRLTDWEDEPGLLRSILSADERQRADRFITARHRRQFVISHAFLRLVLARYLPARAHDLRFGRGSGGKPALMMAPGGVDVHFNLSHCDEVAVVAVAHQPVGVDVEVVRAGDDWEGIAGRYFHPSEHRALARVPDHERQEAFFRCWTRKEAVVKAIGAGLAMPLDSFEVTLAAGAGAALVRHDHRFPRDPAWHLQHLQPLDGVIGAVAMPFAARAVVGTLVSGPIVPQPRAQAGSWRESESELQVGSDGLCTSSQFVARDGG